MLRSKENQKNLMFLIILIILGLVLIFMFCFYKYHIILKQVKVIDDMYTENFIGVNRAWIDIWKGKVNITEKDIEKIELMLNGMEERLKNE